MEALLKLCRTKVIAVNVAGVQFKTRFLTAVENHRFRIAEKADRGMEGLYFGLENISKVEGNTITFRPFV